LFSGHNHYQAQQWEMKRDTRRKEKETV
jgi:hypothetical protein